MPVVIVKMWPRPSEVKRDLAKAITESMVKIAKATADQTIVIFEEVPKEHWAHGGQLAWEPSIKAQ